MTSSLIVLLLVSFCVNFKSMRKVFLLLFIFSLLFAFRFPEGKYDLNEQGLDYALYVPEKLSGKMIVVLHGSGERGKTYVDHWHEAAKKNDYIVVAPDSVDKNGWSLADEEKLIHLIKLVKRTYEVDTVLLNGASSGGHFALYMAFNFPERFDAVCTFMGLVINSLSPRVLPVSSRTKVLPMLLIHGVLDEKIPVKYARWNVQRLREKGYDVTYWEEPDMKHEYYRKVNEDILVWFEEAISQ